MIENTLVGALVEGKKETLKKNVSRRTLIKCMLVEENVNRKC
jgi:hypothetical protein